MTFWHQIEVLVLSCYVTCSGHSENAAIASTGHDVKDRVLRSCRRDLSNKTITGN